MHKQTGSKGCFRCLVGLYRLALILLSLSLPSVAQAQSTIPSLAPNLADSAPDTYVVQQGDTLWDISALFLDEPWRWPELWSVNPDVRDPNLIYPGDVLYLRWDNGTPGVYLSDRPRVGVTKLSPKIRTRPLASASPQRSQRSREMLSTPLLHITGSKLSSILPALRESSVVLTVG